MELNRRFRLGPRDRVALVGAGGKTSLMFQLARDYGTRVICTTTTHLALDQLQGADRHLSVEDPSQLPGLEDHFPEDVLLVTGPEVETNRVSGPGPAVMEKLVGLAAAWDCPLLIEADGARKLPLKAPADHEPPIPDFVDAVIVVIGLSGLGKPLLADWVHRPELYSRLVDLPLGRVLESEHLVRGLVSPEGGLKNIPPGARKILFINQVDSFPNWKTFYQYKDQLLEHYQAIGFGVLADGMLLEVHERIAGVVLAAGGSTRFGEPKQLLDWFGKPLVRHAVDLAREGGLAPVLAITGADHDSVADALGGAQARIVVNPAWASGQSTSVRAAVEALPDSVGGAVFLLVDQPLVTPDLIGKLLKTHQRSPAAIILPQVGNRAGNPVLFDRRVFDHLKELGGDIGGRALFKEFPPKKIPWDDSRSQLDIDTPEDYQQIRLAQDQGGRGSISG